MKDDYKNNQGASSREFGWKDRSLLTPILTPKSSKTIISYVKMREPKCMI